VQPYSLGHSFSFSAMFRQAANTGGYIFARTNRAGNRRFFALYLYRSKPAIVLHYMPEGSQTTQSVRFNFDFPLNDGAWHRVNVVVNGANASAVTATLGIDGVTNLIELPLSGRVMDCNMLAASQDCITLVGARSSSDLRGGSPFMGEIRSAKLRLRTAAVAELRGDVPAPIPVGVSVLDTLEPLAQGEVVPTSSTTQSVPPLFLDGTRAFASRVRHEHSSIFTVSMKLQQSVSSPRGYLFAQSDSSGARFYGLYSLGRSLRFYYKQRGQNDLSSVTFTGAGIADGAIHTVVLVVRQRVAQLFIDDHPRQARVLDGVIESCGTGTDFDCHFVVGGRAANGGTTTAFQMTGTIFNMTIYPGGELPVAAFTPFPVAAHQQIRDDNGNRLVNLLSNPQALVKGGARAIARLGGGFAFDGTGSVLLQSHPAQQSSLYSYAIRATVLSSGYLFAKTDNTGSVRYSALYYSATAQTLTYYYRVATATRSVSFPTFEQLTELTSGCSILVSVSENSATVLVNDGQPVTRGLSGPREDCGDVAPDCLIYAGQRASVTGALSGGRFGLAGNLEFILFYPDVALEAHPSYTPGSEYFTRFENLYISRRNDGGSFSNGVSEAECIQLCLADPLCRSIDVGRVGSQREGACFIAYVNRESILPDAPRASNSYDYLELVSA